MDKPYNDNGLLSKFLCMAYNYCNDENNTEKYQTRKTSKGEKN